MKFSKLKNKVIWLTGASSGIGEALFKQLDRSGARVILSARQKERLQTLIRASSNPVNHLALPLDLSNHDSLSRSVGKVKEFSGHVDVMIHNAGISQRAKAVATVVEVDRRLMEINYFGPVLLTKLLLSDQVSRKPESIVVVSSLVGKIGTPLRSGYAASKHALHGFFESLRAEVTDQGIHILMVCPGFIRTNISFSALSENGTKHDKMDDAQDTGMDPDICAQRILQALLGKKAEVLIGGREVMGVYLFRFLPNLFRKIIRRAKVT